MSKFRDKIEAYHQSLIDKAKKAIEEMASDQNVLLEVILNDLQELMSFIEDCMLELEEEASNE